MCYYFQSRWGCGYWRWANFREQCDREYRMGETCGMKLVYDVLDQGPKCRVCFDMDKKERRIYKMELDIGRWRREGNRSATIERTEENLLETRRQLRALQDKHDLDMRTLAAPNRRTRF